MIARRPGIDVARIGALGLVVFGHLAIAVVDRGPNGNLRGANLLDLAPQWSALAALAPMPVFFAAGGWANATTAPAAAAARVRSLVGVAAAAVLIWSSAVVLTVALTGDGGVIADGARLATQPLWFLAAYVPFAVFARAIATRAAAIPGAGIAALLGALAALDLLRFAGDRAQWIGWPGFYAAWLVPWWVGSVWRDRALTRNAGDRTRAERVAGAVLGASAIVAASVLVARFGYRAALIDAGNDGRSNTNPPTLYTAVAALAQVGILILAAGALDRLGERFAAFWRRAGELAVGVYVWHLSALALCLALMTWPAFPAPQRLSATWWLTRPLWFALVLAVCALLVVATGAVRARLAQRSQRSGRSQGSRHTPPSRPGSAERLGPVGVLGVVLSSAAGAYLGLEGPANATQALVSVGLVGGGWLALRAGAP